MSIAQASTKDKVGWGVGGQGGEGGGGGVRGGHAFKEPPEVHTEAEGSLGQHEQAGGADPYQTPPAPACHFSTSQAQPHSRQVSQS